MKVIVAGYSKTGTKSMEAALTILGYKVYDFLDHFWYHGDDWNKILNHYGSIDDFKRMYEDIDAVVDAPANHFWEEIHEAFPESKIILTTRDIESWFKSWQCQRQCYASNNLYKLMQVLSPTGWRYFKWFQNSARVLCGENMRHPFHYINPNEMILKRNYRQHQTYCMQNAPKDKLLVYNIEEGWKPLCNFLGKDIPDEPFPHENKDGSILDIKMAFSPVSHRAKFETKITIVFLLIIFAVLLASCL